MQSTLSVLSGGWGAGRGWGRLSPLSLSVGQKVLPLPLDRGTGDFGVSTSGLVNIYDVLVIFFFNYVEGMVDPHSKTAPPRPPEACPPPPAPSSAPEGLSRPPCPGQSPRALSRNCSRLRWPSRGHHSYPAGKRAPPCSLHPPLQLPGAAGVAQYPPSCNRSVGLGSPALHPCQQPAPTLLCLDLRLSQIF